ncbi:putative nuclease HARBI1 [Ornithodoros turicata]|uniref:putative nuclease HARBI1 n=1 Tax=Ornithodoros turicata TaxID=34597 RepID=UPI003138E405
MADLYFILEDEGVVEEEPVRTFNSCRDAFSSMSDDEFVATFRLPKEAVREVCEAVREDLQRTRQSHRTTLTVERRVLIALHFYATGAFLGNLAREDTIACSKHAVSEAIHKVTEAILKNLAPKYLRFPTTPDEKLQVKRGFYELAGFPGCVGAIDGTQIAIMQPSLSDPRFVDGNYYCHKGYHSINVLMVCDALRRILFVNARFPGSCHDASVWGACNLHQAAATVFEDGEWLLGDSAYPLQPWLMTPVRSPSTPEEQRFNSAHRRTRVRIEHCFGVLKMRFRCLQRYRTLHFAPNRCCKIINACAVLHNMCLVYNTVEPLDDAGEERAEGGATADPEEAGAEDYEPDPVSVTNRASQLRSQLIRQCFR